MRTQIAIRAMGIRKALCARMTTFKDLEEIGRGASPEEAGGAVDRWLACQQCLPGKMADWPEGLYRRDEACPKCGSTASSVAINGAIRQWWCQACGSPFMPPDSAKITAGAKVLRTQPPDTCEMCGQDDELRPYGPGGIWVCFECAMLDEAEAERQFEKVLNAKRVVGIDQKYLKELGLRYKEPRLPAYMVGIHKSYFPEAIRPKDIGEEFYETVIVPAKSRADAARKAWEARGEEWLGLMGPKQTSVRRVSLHVDEPGTTHTMGRLMPITVYRE